MLITLIFIFVHTESYLFKIIYVLFSLEIRRKLRQTCNFTEKQFKESFVLLNSQKNLFLCGRRLKRLVQISTQICSYVGVPEQKARLSYDNLLRLIDDPDVRDPLKFLRERELVHFQRFGETLENVLEQLDAKNFYAYNPAFDAPDPCCRKKK